MGSYRGNTDKVMADASKIARRLRNGQTSQDALRKEYRCGHTTIMRAVLSQISKGQWAKLRHQILARSGVKGRFQKGVITWNKGRRGWFAPGSEKTRFKKGHLPHTHKEVGTITTHNDKCGKQFHWIKVCGRPRGRHKWIPFARHVWQKKNGRVPDGYFVVHIDGNTLNDDIKNLRLVDRRGHAKLQQERDPSIIERMKRSSAEATRRRHLRNRIEKARAAKEAAIFGNNVMSQWECIGCGQDYPGEPPAICNKCNGLRFSLVKVRQIA